MNFEGCSVGEYEMEEGVFSNETTSSEVLSNEVLSNEVLSSEVLSREVQPNETTSSEVLSSEVLSNEVQPNEVQPNETTSSEVLSNEVQPNETTSSDVLQPNKKPLSLDERERFLEGAGKQNAMIGGHIELTMDYPIDFPFQCFLTNSHGHYAESRVEHWKNTKIHFDDDIYRVVHLSYVTYPWGLPSETRTRSLADIRFASTCANIMGFDGIVLHLSKDYHMIEDFETVIRACFAELQPPCRLYFEPIGNTPSIDMPDLPIDRMLECQEAIDRVSTNWSYCFDTAHAFIQGQPLTTAADVKAFIDRAPRIGIIHLNGSKYPIRSGRDSHANIRGKDDFIWGRVHSGLKTFLHWARDNKIPCYLERSGCSQPSDYSAEIKRIKKWI